MQWHRPCKRDTLRPAGALTLTWVETRCCARFWCDPSRISISTPLESNACLPKGSSATSFRAAKEPTTEGILFILTYMYCIPLVLFCVSLYSRSCAWRARPLLVQLSLASRRALKASRAERATRSRGPGDRRRVDSQPTRGRLDATDARARSSCACPLRDESRRSRSGRDDASRR